VLSFELIYTVDVAGLAKGWSKMMESTEYVVGWGTLTLINAGLA
jgi:hypothetical protein